MSDNDGTDIPPVARDQEKKTPHPWEAWGLTKEWKPKQWKEPISTLPDNWEELVRSTMPPSEQKLWLCSKPKDPDWFRLVLAAYEEGKKPENHGKYAVSFLGGVKWCPDVESANNLANDIEDETCRRVFVTPTIGAPPAKHVRISNLMAKVKEDRLLLQLRAKTRTYGEKTDSRAVFDTGATHTCLAERLFEPDQTQRMRRMSVGTATDDNVQMRFILEPVTARVGNGQAVMNEVNLSGAYVTHNSLIGMDVIKHATWTIGGDGENNEVWLLGTDYIQK